MAYSITARFLLEDLSVLCSEPKRPASPSSGRDGGQYLKGPRDRRAGTAGVSGGVIFRVTPDDGRALQVPFGSYRSIENRRDLQSPS